MKDTKLMQFLEYLTTDDSRFRIAVLFYPLLLAIGSFILWWLLKGRNSRESLLFSAFIFLLSCFIGIVSQAVRRKNLR